MQRGRSRADVQRLTCRRIGDADTLVAHQTAAGACVGTVRRHVQCRWAGRRRPLRCACPALAHCSVHQMRFSTANPAARCHAVCCVSGTICKYVNDWYFQCQPSASAAGSQQLNPSGVGMHLAWKAWSGVRAGRCQTRTQPQPTQPRCQPTRTPCRRAADRPVAAVRRQERLPGGV